jgi:hypothetical protein
VHGRCGENFRNMDFVVPFIKVGVREGGRGSDFGVDPEDARGLGHFGVLVVRLIFGKD